MINIPDGEIPYIYKLSPYFETKPTSIAISDDFVTPALIMFWRIIEDRFYQAKKLFHKLNYS